MRASIVYQQVALAPFTRLASDSDTESESIDEDRAKQALAEFGLTVPLSYKVSSKSDLLDAQYRFNYPLVLKGLGVAHKTELNAVVLGIQSRAEFIQAIDDISDCPNGYLIEQMVDDVVTELAAKEISANRAYVVRAILRAAPKPAAWIAAVQKYLKDLRKDKRALLLCHIRRILFLVRT